MIATESVPTHHLETFSEANVEGTMSDYADNAVFISEGKVLKGHDEIRDMFADLLPEFDNQEGVFSLDEQIAVDDYAYIV